MKKVIAIITMLFNMAYGQVFFAPGPLAEDGQPLELGMVFRPTAGSIFTGIRFYKADNLQGYTVSLWDSAGNRLFSAPVPTIAKGWVQVPLPAVQLQGRKFVVSYFCPVGNYAAKQWYFTADSVYPSLVIPKAAGVYKYAKAGGFPTSTFNNCNYYVEPIISPPGSPVTRRVDTIRTVRDTTQIVIFRDTCVQIDYSKIANLSFSVEANDSGLSRLPDSVTVYRAIFGVNPPNFGSGDILYTFFPKTAAGQFRVRLYRLGWTVEMKQPDGSWKPYKP